MVTGWPTPYDPYFDLDIEFNPFKDNREGLKADLKESIEFYQSEIGTLTRIKEQAKDDQEMQTLLKTIIEDELLIIKTTWEKINDL